MIKGRLGNTRFHCWMRRDLVTPDKKNAKVLNAFFASVFSARHAFRNLRSQWPGGKSGARKVTLLERIGCENTEENWTYISPQVLRELAGVIVRLLLTVLDLSCLLGELPENWKSFPTIMILWFYESKCHFCLQKEQEGRLRELQNIHPHLDPCQVWWRS